MCSGYLRRSTSYVTISQRAHVTSISRKNFNSAYKTPPLVEVRFYRKVSFGARDLSVVWNSVVVRYSGAVNVNGNSSWYINCRPLFVGCPLLEVSVIGGSTVSSLTGS